MLDYFYFGGKMLLLFVWLPFIHCKKKKNALVRQSCVQQRMMGSLFHKQGINVHLAKKMIDDRSRDYMNARRVAKVRLSPKVYNAWKLMMKYLHLL